MCKIYDVLLEQDGLPQVLPLAIHRILVSAPDPLGLIGSLNLVGVLGLRFWSQGLTISTSPQTGLMRSCYPALASVGRQAAKAGMLIFRYFSVIKIH